MAYLDRWKTIFPETVGSETRPSDPIDDSLDFNTDGFPQFIANDPVRYDLQNAFLMQLFSNDARLGELIDALDGALDDHKTDAGAHASGIAGNAGSATKLKTARSIQTDLASTQAKNFDGTGNISPGVTGILPPANGGTGQNALSAVTVGKASQLETARKIDGVSFSGAGDIIHYGTCSTAAATAAKTVSCNNYTLTTGSLVFVKFTVTNTAASPTLNVNNTGAKAIQYSGSAIAARYLAENRTYVFVYDGSAYQLIGDINSDTHWTTHLYAGSGTAANASTSNGNTKLTVTDNSTVRNSITLKGTGATTVVSDANGNITINSTDNNTTYSNFVKSGTGAKNGLVPAPSTTAGTTKYLREDCTWQVPPDNNTTYSANNGVGLSGTTFYNSGVRSIATGSANGTISVNTNGTAANVAVKGLASAAYSNWDNAVHTSGAQTISGNKTFTADMYYSNSAPKIVQINTSDTISSKPSSNNTWHVRFFDKNSTACGSVMHSHDTDNSHSTILYSRDKGDTTWAALLVKANASAALSVEPYSNKTHSLGASSKLWTTVYAQTATINTSDEREKTLIGNIPDAVLDVWKNVNLVRYKLKDSVNEKGEKARFHTGCIAQNVDAEFKKVGLDPREYGFFCYDEWDGHEATYDEAGVEETPEIIAGNQYSIRYEEALCIEAAYQRRRADRLEARVAALEAFIMRANSNGETDETTWPED